jgi:hypothetical protein
VVKDGPGRKGSLWIAAQRACMQAAQDTMAPCALCGRAIDYALTRAYPLHRMAGTVHHIRGLAQGGPPLDPANLTPAHRGCNTRHSNRIRAYMKQQRQLIDTQLNASRIW